MEAKFSRDGNGFWVPLGDGDGTRSSFWASRDVELRLKLIAPELYAAVRTEGWNPYTAFADDVPGPFKYDMAGLVELDPDQTLGLITLEGVEDYSGELRVEISVDDPAKSRIDHHKASESYPRREEVIYFAIFTAVDHLKWLREEISRRPNDAIIIKVQATLYASSDNDSTWRGRFCLEPDNNYVIWPERRCAISGVEIQLCHWGDAEAPTLEAPDEATPTTPPLSINSFSTESIVTSLQWIIGILALLTLIVLLKGCSL